MVAIVPLPPARFSMVTVPWCSETMALPADGTRDAVGLAGDQRGGWGASVRRDRHQCHQGDRRRGHPPRRDVRL